MASPTASETGPSRPGQDRDADRLGRRDLLVLRLELQRRRRGATAGQRATRSTR
jgi:hypothetical protein